MLAAIDVPMKQVIVPLMGQTVVSERNMFRCVRIPVNASLAQLAAFERPASLAR